MVQPMKDILTVTLNPALDISTTTDRVIAGPKLRCDPIVVDPGGGGINVARVAAEMGAHARAFVALAGPSGMRLEATLSELGIPLVRMKAPDETRESFAVHDRETGAQYRFVLPGPQWSEEDVAESQLLGSVGEYGWAGAYGTYFLVDPKEDLVAMFLPQLRGSGFFPIRQQFNNVVYQALIN